MKTNLNFQQFCHLFVVILLSKSLSAGSIFINDPSSHSLKIQIFNKEGELLSFNRTASTNVGNHSFTWTGENQNNSSFLLLSVSKRKVKGVVLGTENDFRFKGNLKDQKIFTESRSSRPCGGCRITPSAAKDPRPRDAAQKKHSWRSSDAGQIDLMVVFPTVVKNEIGGLQDTLLEINNAVAGANLCFRNSEVPIQIRLVHHHETDYVPTGSLDVDLERLTGKNDGYLDDVHTLRDQYGADIVTLLSTDSDMGGLANTLSYPSISFEESAFNVCVWDQIGAPVFTLAHEIGHNMGCLHNREDASGSLDDYDYKAFAFGKRWFLEGEGYRTIMAYNDASKSYNNSIPFFSNPSVSYLGVPTGNSGQEDNALALTISAPYVSNFKDSKVQGILPSVFSANVEEGNYSTFWVRLSTKPQSQIEVNLSLSNENDFLLGSTPKIIFDQNNWNLRQSVQVIALQDIDDSDETGILTFSSNGLSSIDTQIQIKDNSSESQTSEVYFSGVTENPFGYAVDGVSLHFSNGDFNITSDLNGTFLTTLSSGYSGTITPTKSGYSFLPQSITVSNLSSHSLGNAFVATRSPVVYVNHLASGKNDGTSWDNAFTNLSTALSLVDSFTEIWVARGKYLPGNVRSASFLLPTGVTVLGGFSGSEINSSDRDFFQNETILSGDIGVSDDSTDNSFHVVIPMNGSLLDGFIIEDGNATENFSDDRGKGAGIWAEDVDFEIRNCVLRNNWAFQGGGAVWLSDTNASFLDCNFSFNATGGTGSAGAVWAVDSNLTIQSSFLYANYASYWGGALRIDDGNLSLMGCTLSQNESKLSNGGGAWYQNGGTFSISNSSFSQNGSTLQGGAALIRSAGGFFYDSNFSGNYNSVSNGGGALFIENCSPKLFACRFLNNTTNANNHGGAIKLVTSNADIEKCVFQSNRSLQNSGGAIFIDESSSPILKDNEFRGNSAVSWGGAIYCKNNDLNVSGGLFLANWSEYGGGIATNGTSQLNFENLIILGNESNASNTARGGFLYLGTDAVTSKFINCIIAGNKSAYRQGVVSPKGDISFTNCTIFGNQATGLGSIALLFDGDSIVFENSIVWGNTDENSYEIYVNTGSASASYSLINPTNSPNLVIGEGVITADPLFVDADGVDDLVGTEDDNFLLSSGSPAIDVGSHLFTDYKGFDLEGRVRDANPDLGALKHYVNSSPSIILSSSELMVQENQSLIVDLNATDADGDELQFSIIGGEDQSLFSIGGTSGILSSKSTLDYEYPNDSNHDNRYLVKVQVSDGNETSEVDLTLIILNVDETAQSPEDSTLLVNGYSLNNGWRQASWFGLYYSEFFPWVFHPSMGWVYVIQEKEGSCWMWHSQLEWIWTDISLFPYFLINSIQSWGYTGDGEKSGEYYLFKLGEEGWLEF